MKTKVKYFSDKQNLEDSLSEDLNTKYIRGSSLDRKTPDVDLNLHRRMNDVTNGIYAGKRKHFSPYFYSLTVNDCLRQNN